MTRDLSRLWSRYEVERERLESDCFDPAFARLDALVEDTAKRNDLVLDVRRMVGEVLEELGERHVKTVRGLQSEVQRNAVDLRERALSVARQGFQAVDNSVRSTLVAFEHTDAGQLLPENLQRTRERLERHIAQTAEEQTALLERLRDQLKAAATPEALQGDEVLAALEGELEERRERDLAQVPIDQIVSEYLNAESIKRYLEHQMKGGLACSVAAIFGPTPELVVEVAARGFLRHVGGLGRMNEKAGGVAVGG